MATDETIPTIGRVVGENLRRLREQRGQTQDEAVVQAVFAGLPWTRARLAFLETGRRDDITVTELLLLSLAFNVSPAYWFEGSGQMLVGHLVLPREGIRLLVAGQALTAGRGRSSDAAVSEWLEAVGGITEADANAARALGVQPGRVRTLAKQLWGRTLIDEREARISGVDADAAPDQRSARRGHITRVLLQELRQALEKEGSDGPG